MNQIVITRTQDGSIAIKEMSVTGTDREHVFTPSVGPNSALEYLRNILESLKAVNQ